MADPDGQPGTAGTYPGRGEATARWRAFASAHPDVVAAYEALRRACAADGPLDVRAVSVAKLAVSVGSGAERTTHAHARKALEVGASPDELRHVAILALPIIGLSAMRDALKRIEQTIAEQGEPSESRHPGRDPS